MCTRIAGGQGPLRGGQERVAASQCCRHEATTLTSKMSTPPSSGDHASTVILALSLRDAADASTRHVRRVQQLTPQHLIKDGERRAGHDQAKSQVRTCRFSRQRPSAKTAKYVIIHLSLKCGSCGTNAALCAKTSTGTSDRAQQDMTWICPSNQKHHSVKGALKKERVQLAKEERGVNC